MNYQDQKIKAIGRSTIMAAVFTALLVASLTFPDQTRAFIQRLPLPRRWHDDWIWMAIFATMAPISWLVTLGMMFTSPEQEVRFVNWSKRWRKSPIEFEQIEFDTSDPDYRKVAWRYFLDRRKS